MRLEDFDFDLPDAAIARYPADRRDASRLLVLRRAEQTLEHARFVDLPKMLRAGDLVVVNDTKVLHARLDAKKKETGGKVEILLVEPIAPRSWRAMVNTSKALRPGQTLVVAPDVELSVEVGSAGGFCVLRLPSDASELAHRFGQVPLPPYLGRAVEDSDRERYQTIFAREGADRSVAAPTAGLHFTPEVISALAKRGVEWTKLTLHVGPGTFLPVRTERIDDHVMHAERYEVDAVAADMIERTRAKGGRVVGVGTTVTRVLETIGRPAKPTSGATDLFIRPGYAFCGIDCLLTNFHLPKSTLLMLVAAFAGYDFTMRAYREAVSQGYRFFSYGDAMLIL
jgi:S-adenosylmethionine:tRNA ribosyltransferase-isomerase